MKHFLLRIFPHTSAVRLFFHRIKADVAAIRYGFPARKLTVIGITGTDGKTTTVGMTAHILNACGKKTGALSTAFFMIGNDTRWNPTQKTSPSPFLVQKFLRDLVRSGCTHAVLECSSHGLLQGRLNHTNPSVAGITNISEEHLDYHGSMEGYIQAKSKLFSMLSRQSGIAVLNACDASFAVLRSIVTPWRIVFGKDETIVRRLAGDDLGLWTSDVSQSQKGVSADISCNANEGPFHLDLPIAGAFNVQNALCAVSCAHAAGVRIDRCVDALSSFAGIPGRLERIGTGYPFETFVDFTVTPQSYRATLATLASRVSDGGRLLVLAGSCGDRMKEKRPQIGSICTSAAALTVVTNEDPYSENPEEIIDQIIAGVASDIPVFDNEHEVPASLPPRCCVRISDRLRAIRFVLSQAKPRDIVLLAGKGSDTTMMTREGQIPWNERQIVIDELKALAAASSVS